MHLLLKLFLFKVVVTLVGLQVRRVIKRHTVRAAQRHRP